MESWHSENNVCQLMYVNYSSYQAYEVLLDHFTDER